MYTKKILLSFLITCCLGGVVAHPANIVYEDPGISVGVATSTPRITIGDDVKRVKPPITGILSVEVKLDVPTNQHLITIKSEPEYDEELRNLLAQLNILVIRNTSTPNSSNLSNGESQLGTNLDSTSTNDIGTAYNSTTYASQGATKAHALNGKQILMTNNQGRYLQVNKPAVDLPNTRKLFQARNFDLLDLKDQPTYVPLNDSVNFEHDLLKNIQDDNARLVLKQTQSDKHQLGIGSTITHNEVSATNEDHLQDNINVIVTTNTQLSATQALSQVLHESNENIVTLPPVYATDLNDEQLTFNDAISYVVNCKQHLSPYCNPTNSSAASASYYPSYSNILFITEEQFQVLKRLQVAFSDDPSAYDLDEVITIRYPTLHQTITNLHQQEKQHARVQTIINPSNSTTDVHHRNKSSVANGTTSTSNWSPTIREATDTDDTILRKLVESQATHQGEQNISLSDAFYDRQLERFYAERGLPNPHDPEKAINFFNNPQSTIDQAREYLEQVEQKELEKARNATSESKRLQLQQETEALSFFADLIQRIEVKKVIDLLCNSDHRPIALSQQDSIRAKAYQQRFCLTKLTKLTLLDN